MRRITWLRVAPFGDMFPVLECFGLLLKPRKQSCQMTLTYSEGCPDPALLKAQAVWKQLFQVRHLTQNQNPRSLRLHLVMMEPPNKNHRLRLKAFIPRQAGQQGRPPKWIQKSQLRGMAKLVTSQNKRKQPSHSGIFLGEIEDRGELYPSGMSRPNQ